ncbi:MAG: hypothetical protein L0H55_06165, partial [Candidatus Nitrosocosmicus sp.]|nr:hypothetical protein [Candidatus Nitrosocosmicus sp.]
MITRYKIDPELAKRDKKKKHQEEIFGIYEKWLESPFSYKVDLTDFNLDKLNIAFKESFPTRLINQVEVPQSVEEQALYHLYQENNDSFTKYKQILEKKNEFNINIEKFLNKIKKDLINILKSKGLEKYEELIDSPLRF